MATLCAETHAVLKLDLGDKGGIRRIALVKLWDPTNSRVSYQRLSEMALEYSSLSDSKLHRVTVTYTDEDGDTITISTDDELTDAFEQFATRVPPIVRAKASFQVEKDSKKIVKELKQAISAVGEMAKGDEAKVGQIQDVLESFLTILNQTDDSSSINVEGMKQRKKYCRKESRPRNRYNLSYLKPDATSKGKEAVKDEDETPKKCSNILPVKADLDKGFIHGRHTCDACLVTPIIGIRYHALNLPDHDLCEKCVLTQTNIDIIFEPTELERDRHLQNKWKHRRWRQNRGVEGCYGRQRCNAVGNLAVCSADTAMKEAIRRSLEDVKPTNEEPVEQDNETCFTENEEDTVESIFTENDEDDEEFLNVSYDESSYIIENMKTPNAENNDNAPDAEEISLVSTESKIVDKIEEKGSLADISFESSSTEDTDAEDNEDTYTEDVSVTTEPKIVNKIDNQDILPSTSNESSFTEDAEGKGDVAVAIGNALDVTANAIDAILSEVEKPVDVYLI